MLITTLIIIITIVIIGQDLIMIKPSLRTKRRIMDSTLTKNTSPKKQQIFFKILLYLETLKSVQLQTHSTYNIIFLNLVQIK